MSGRTENHKEKKSLKLMLDVFLKKMLKNISAL